MPKHVRKGDMVIVTSGSFKGEIGSVMRVIPEDDRVVVKGVNMRTKHIKPSRVGQGGIITREEPIHISKVSPVVDGKPTRVRFETREDGSKIRVAVRNGQELGVIHGPRTSTAGGAGMPVAPRRAIPAKKVAKAAGSKVASSKTASSKTASSKTASSKTDSSKTDSSKAGGSKSAKSSKKTEKKAASKGSK
ncbi:MAG: 50S ribosomal protein L24 [Phycisphaerales bacterium]|nr:50S ribosomal protein L24 [Phycisphaerales bacterium]